jgi:hypothetical protein
MLQKFARNNIKVAKYATKVRKIKSLWVLLDRVEQLILAHIASCKCTTGCIFLNPKFDK